MGSRPGPPQAVFVLSQATPLRGMERAAAAVVEMLGEAGADVVLHPLVTAPRPRRVGRLRDLAASFVAARRLVREPGPPLVLVGIWVGLRVLPFRRRHDRAVVAWEHSLTLERRAALRSFDLVARLVLPLYAHRAARGVAVSPAVATALAAAPRVGPRLAELTVVVPNPVALSVGSGGASGGSVPAAPSGAARLLAIGGLEPLKNPELLLEALVLLPQARLDLAGGGPRLAALQALAARLGVGGRVIWHGHTDRVPELLAACDVVVHASRSETFGYALLEAAAAHRPVVAVATEQARALVPGQVPGLTAPADATAFAAAVEVVLAEPPSSSSFAAADAARAAAYAPSVLESGWRAVLRG